MLHAGYQLAVLDAAEENLICQCPPEVARHFTPHMQRLVGYAQPYRNLSRFSAGVVNPGDGSERGGSDPAQALRFERAADWATEAAPTQPPSTAAQAQALMLEWGSITDSTLAGWCEDLLPPIEAGVVAVPCSGTPTMMRTMVAALSRDGAVVLEGAIPAATCAAIIQELGPYHGRLSRVIGGVVARLAAARDCALHPALLALAEGVLGHQCLRPQGEQI